MLLDNAPNEDSTAYITLKFFQPNGHPATPDRLVYRIEDRTSGNVGGTIRGDTSIDVTSNTVSITLSTTDNTITNEHLENRRRLVFVAPYNGGLDQITGEVDWCVNRLSALPSL